jgi:hypothetical protein
MADPLDQLAKLLAMLSSPYDNEVAIAARKICGLMVTNDWSWPQLLANGNATSLTEEQLQRVFAAGIQKGESLGYERGLVDGGVAASEGKSKPKAPSVQIGNDIGWLRALLDAAVTAETAGQLDEFERSITNGHRDKIARFGRSTYLSQPQFDCFKRLETKLQKLGHL